MSSRRSKLFLSLRLFFWADVVLFVVLVSWFFYLRHHRSRLLEIVERQLAFNVRLSNDLAYANNLITNTFYSAASSFVSNVLVSSSSVASPSSPFSLPGNIPQSSDDIPPLTFSRYFEVDGIPYVHLRNQRLKRGDFVLGYPLEDISADVVKYRGKYFKLDQDIKPSKASIDL